MSGSPGNALRLLHNGAEYFPALLAEIAAARHDILLETYIFEPDETGRQVARALGAAARRGVRVRLTVDGFGSRSFVDGLMGTLLAEGVAVRIFRRELATLALHRRRLRRLHRKLACIDGRVAFVGGINIIGDHHPRLTHPRHDYAVRLEGPLLADISTHMERQWLMVSRAFLHGELRMPRPHPDTRRAGPIDAEFVVRDNLRHRRDIEEAYLQAIRAARHEIILANAYFLPGRRFRQALVAAAARGVQVTLLLQGRVEYWLQHLATRALYPYLQQRGIRIHEYQKSFLHAKVAVIDGHWSTVGSSNIDPFSLLLAREANLVVRDEAFAGELRDSLLQAMAEGAHPLDPQDWLPERRRLARAAEWIAYSLVRFAVGLAGYRGRH